MSKYPDGNTLISIRIGAFFFWLLSGFQGDYKSRLDKKFNKRNMWTGYLITLVIAGLIYWFLIHT
ncbi:hypothetical protein ACI6Q2_08745 [Chitinophagaceae bacterium LWZ2-11]